MRGVLLGAESMADEMLIGFDAREAGEYDPRWDDKRRERFILRHDVARPLSVDRHAWATIFYAWYSRQNRQWARSLPKEERERFRSVLGGLSEEERHRQGLGSVRVPDWAVGGNAPLWENLSRMRSNSATSARRPKTAIGGARSGLQSSTNTTCSAITSLHSPLPRSRTHAFRNSGRATSTAFTGSRNRNPHPR